MPSPTCTINNSATPQDVTASSTVSGALANAAGVVFWGVTCISTDELNSAATINGTLTVNQGAKTFSFTAPAQLGSKLIFQSTVGAAGSTQGHGVDVNGNYQASYTTTFAVNVLTSGGLRVTAVGEEFEQDANFGWTNEVNKGIRANGGSTPGLTPVPVSGGGSITLSNNQIAYVDASSGTCSVTPPTLVSGALFGVADAHHGTPRAPTFSSSHGASIVNSGSNLEDPNAATGAMAPNPCLIITPGFTGIWQGDPTGTFWKLVG